MRKLYSAVNGALDFYFDVTARFHPFVGASIVAIYSDGVHDTGII